MKTLYEAYRMKILLLELIFMNIQLDVICTHMIDFLTLCHMSHVTYIHTYIHTGK